MKTEPAKGYVAHWVLSDCVQRGRARGHDVAVAVSMSAVNCKACVREIAELRDKALGTRLPDVRLTTENEKLRRENVMLRAQMDEFTRCPMCRTARLEPRDGADGRYLVCTTYPTCRFSRPLYAPSPEERAAQPSD